MNGASKANTIAFAGFFFNLGDVLGVEKGG
jgi:hypothetical protein